VAVVAAASVYSVVNSGNVLALSATRTRQFFFGMQHEAIATGSSSSTVVSLSGSNAAAMVEVDSKRSEQWLRDQCIL
jgi:hypothetical protein